MDLRARRLAESASAAIGVKSGVRILHASDLHNRVRGTMWIRALASATNADVLAFTGDLSGLGSLAERAFWRMLRAPHVPAIYCRGNHDSDRLARYVLSSGGVAMDGRVRTAGGLSWWGYEDPNVTRLLIGPKYRPSLCVSGAKNNSPGSAPVVVAVHNDLMVPVVPQGVRLVLTGHYHRQRYLEKDGCHFVRCGSSGGGGPFGGDMHACVIDVDPVDHAPLGIWALSTADGGVSETWLRS